MVLHDMSPSGEDQCETLRTIGLSDRNIPVGQFRFNHHELRVMLQRGWPLSEDALRDPHRNWPVEALKRIVHGLLSVGRWPDEPALFMNGNPPQALGPNVGFTGWLALQSPDYRSIFLSDYRTVTFWDLFPIYSDEAEYARQHGTEALVERFDQRGVPLYVVRQRENVGV